MAIAGMNHFTVLTDDVAATVAFYRDLLGLVEGPRPAFGFPGAWLYAGGQPVLHLIGGRARGELTTGVIDHIAFSASGLATMCAALATRGIAYTCGRQTGSGIWQVFLHDPNGARVELDFAADEIAPR
jgi:catechol 2,3-dioxygenase-like lactoylglutathione lyase family enzyme